MPDSQTLALVAAAMVAGVILFRLYTILGRRTGHEPPPPVQQPKPLTPPAASAPAEAPPSSSGLLDIQLADPAFDTPKFLAGAREAYTQIVTAFAAGDRGALKPLLSADVYAAFDAGISARTAPAPALVKLHDARIVGSVLHGRTAEVTLAFTAEFSGDAGTNTVTDVWTFERNLDSPDPNWTLVATSGELPE